jgi:hypothetical protein
MLSGVRWYATETLSRRAPVAGSFQQPRVEEPRQVAFVRILMIFIIHAHIAPLSGKVKQKLGVARADKRCTHDLIVES